MKPSGIGGQGVIDGVMMRNKDNYVLAIRKSDNGIEFIYEECKHMKGFIPLFRGIFAFWGAIILGIKALTGSSDYREENSKNKSTTIEKLFNSLFGRSGDEMFMGIVVLISVVMSIALFVVLPYKGGEYLAKNYIESYKIQLIAEAGIRAVLLIIYMLYLSFKPDLRRCYMYHGAEHKVINCLEHGESLTIENVKKYSKVYRGCENNIIFEVLFLSTVAIGFIRYDNIWIVLGLRIASVFVISAVFYEFVRLSGRSNNFIVRLFNLPAMFFQRLTVKEPKDDMIEVAIASVEAVFDWRAYIQENVGYMPTDGGFDVHQFDDMSQDDAVVMDDMNQFAEEVYEDYSLEEDYVSEEDYQEEDIYQGHNNCNQGNYEESNYEEDDYEEDVYDDNDYKSQDAYANRDNYNSQSNYAMKDRYNTQESFNNYNNGYEPKDDFDDYDEEYEEEYDDYSEDDFDSYSQSDYIKEPNPNYSNNYNNQYNDINIDSYHNANGYQNQGLYQPKQSYQSNQPEQNYHGNQQYNNYDIKEPERGYNNYNNYNQNTLNNDGYGMSNYPVNGRDFTKNNDFQEENDEVLNALDRMFDDDNY